jgi:hypothetical protein
MRDEQCPKPDILEACSTLLILGITAALPGWVERKVREVVDELGIQVTSALESSACTAAKECQDEVGPQISEFLQAPPSRELKDLLAFLDNAAVPYPTKVLHAANIPKADRPPWLVKLNPDNFYNIHIRWLDDLSPNLEQPALLWAFATASNYLVLHGGRFPAEIRRIGPRPVAPDAEAITLHLPDVYDTRGDWNQ